MVLCDAKGSFIWQSFDHPTDTLLVGQSLWLSGPTELVRRASTKYKYNGSSGLVMERRRLAIVLKNVTFYSSPEYNDESSTYDLAFNYKVVDGSTSGSAKIARLKYNANQSFLWLEIDGNLRVYTYDNKVDWDASEVTFTLFAMDSPHAIWDTECHLPQRCGDFGLCADNQCVACPTPNGLLGWTEKCNLLPVTTFCGASNVKYYMLEGVDHFMSKYAKGDGPMELGMCKGRCTKDCKCLGYFYHMETSRCWIAYGLKTITRSENSTHLGFIRYI
ncbi:hypothetical protein Nepgr_027412 [Nepenthes gracilis]|uniref:Uncharacterized protein n=1 Tax=Nepenthes gracilis TaxID=150966 RepID=A0AAD3TAB0_NEPGR|nr:hypothetical protein Nepgr_027412 [Nepenthes gracilis]